MAGARNPWHPLAVTNLMSLKARRAPFVICAKRWFAPVAFIAVFAFIAICCAATYLIGLSTGRALRPITRVTAAAAARAMADDDFYSSFGDSTLLVTGSVASSTKTAEGTLVSFDTGSSFGASCEVATSQAKFTPGMTVTFVTQAEAANRDAAGVTLTGCVLP